jgi:hypothetical protein
MVLNDTATARIIAENPTLFCVVTPIDVDCFERLMVSHPKRPLITSVCRSLREEVWPFAFPDESSLATFDFPNTL